MNRSHAIAIPRLFRAVFARLLTTIPMLLPLFSLSLYCALRKRLVENGTDQCHAYLLEIPSGEREERSKSLQRLTSKVEDALRELWICIERPIENGTPTREDASKPRVAAKKELSWTVHGPWVWDASSRKTHAMESTAVDHVRAFERRMDAARWSGARAWRELYFER